MNATEYRIGSHRAPDKVLAPTSLEEIQRTHDVIGEHKRLGGGAVRSLRCIVPPSRRSAERNGKVSIHR